MQATDRGIVSKRGVSSMDVVEMQIRIEPLATSSDDWYETR
jgi:hypothetical protein